MSKEVNTRGSEHGGAGVKFLLVVVVLFLIANGCYQWIPVAYAGESFKQEMQAAVLQAATIPPSSGTPTDVTKKRIQKIAFANSIPTDAFIEVKMINSNIQARVSYVKPVAILPFGLYTYNYEFDYTATPAGFLTKD